jgi:hypothetical protein
VILAWLFLAGVLLLRAQFPVTIKLPAVVRRAFPTCPVCERKPDGPGMRLLVAAPLGESSIFDRAVIHVCENDGTLYAEFLTGDAPVPGYVVPPFEKPPE